MNKAGILSIGRYRFRASNDSTIAWPSSLIMPGVKRKKRALMARSVLSTPILIGRFADRGGRNVEERAQDGQRGVRFGDAEDV
jgi:hypothetical protein